MLYVLWAFKLNVYKPLRLFKSAIVGEYGILGALHIREKYYLLFKVCNLPLL